MDILDMILGSEMANEYTDSVRVDKKVTKTISFDGDTTGKTVFPVDDTRVLIKVSNTPLDPTRENVKRIVLRGIVLGEPKTQVIERSDLIIDGGREEQGYIILTKGEIQCGAYSLFAENDAGLPEGVYFLRIESTDGYSLEVASLEYETREIDPKLIPGAVLPVVELTTAATINGEMLSESEAQVMDALKGGPCILKFNLTIGDGTMSFVVCPFVVKMGEMDISYIIMVTFGTVELHNGGDGWEFGFAPTT